MWQWRYVAAARSDHPDLIVRSFSLPQNTGDSEAFGSGTAPAGLAEGHGLSSRDGGMSWLYGQSTWWKGVKGEGPSAFMKCSRGQVGHEELYGTTIYRLRVNM